MAFLPRCFCYSDFVGAGAALTWSQMKEMSASHLIEIQPHSKTHANLTLRLADESDARYRERARREVETPVGNIKERLETSSTTFAYPYGDVNESVVNELTRLGVLTGVTVTPGGNGFSRTPTCCGEAWCSSTRISRRSRRSLRLSCGPTRVRNV